MHHIWAFLVRVNYAAIARLFATKPNFSRRIAIAEGDMPNTSAIDLNGFAEPNRFAVAIVRSRSSDPVLELRRSCIIGPSTKWKASDEG
jgi:hypothetical protein